MTNYDRIPEELKALPNWVAFALVRRGEKWTKLPINPKTGQLASSTNPKTWGTYEQALRAAKQLAGIGFVFTSEAGYAGIDMDGHVDDELIHWFDSYAEYSQSGKGVHIIIKASVPEGRKGPKYEIYGNARFFVMTGNVIHDRPIAERQEQADAFIADVFPPQEQRTTAKQHPQPAPTSTTIDLSQFCGGICNKPLAEEHRDDDPIEMAKNSAQGAKFSDLWAGNWKGAYESQSSADAALLAMLRFWTGGNQAESFRLFRASGLMRDKWNREDYRERTWRSIDSGEVYQPRKADYVIGRPADQKPAETTATTTQARQGAPFSTHAIQEALSPWRKTRIGDVLKALEGTSLGRVVEHMRAPMRDQEGNPLPAEVGLVKALVLFGCALSGKREKPRESGNLVAHTANGAALARVRIVTGGGQVPNVMALLVGASASGKDVGGLIDRVANAYGWLIGTAGSEEGIADACISKPNGLLSISEFSNFIDRDHWASRAASFLTTAFNKGWFSHSMSKRSQGQPRETNYCYPNVYANIQPDILQAKANTQDIASGFLGRFLIAQMPSGYRGEATGELLDDRVEDCKNLLAPLVALDADFHVDWGYSFPLINLFADAKAQPEATYLRLCREYYPRFALMLSAIPGEPLTQIRPEAWERAAVLVQYFFAQAEAVLTDISDDPIVAKRDKLMERMLASIKAAGSAGISRSALARNFSRGIAAQDRNTAIQELTAKELITLSHPGGVPTYSAA